MSTSISGLRLLTRGVPSRVRKLQGHHRRIETKTLSTSRIQSLGSSSSLLGARKIFPNPHFTTSEFPEEPLGYSADIGAGFFQGGPGYTLGPRDRYEIQAKLGWGTTSSVWLAKDREASSEGDQHVTIKILAGYATKLNEASMVFRELEIAKLLASQTGGGHVGKIRDHFIEPGVDKDDGEHICLVTEFYPNDVQTAQYSLGGKPLPVPVVKKILSDLAKGLAEIHEHGVVHTDLKSSNILIKPKSDTWRKGGAIDAWYERHPPQKSHPVRTPKGMKSSWITQSGPPLLERLEDWSFVLSDFSHGEFVDEKTAPQVCILPLRAPELLVEFPGWDQKIDMWSYGVFAFHLLTNGVIFFPARLPGFPARASIIESMLYQMISTTGEDIPDWLLRWGLQSGRYFELFDPERRGRLINFDRLEHAGPISDVLLGVASQAGTALKRRDLEGASDLLTKCLRLDPKERASAKTIAQHHWLR